jgi:predicted amidophosphoribosyltransferase
MVAVKQDQVVISEGKQLQMSEFVARTLKSKLDSLPFAPLFADNPILVPTPSSSLKKPESLDVPSRIAQAMKKELGNEVAECLLRSKPLSKSATSAAANRSTAIQHFESLQVQDILTKPQSILLIDDVVTRGATLLGAANRLSEAYPSAMIAAFVALRAVSNPIEFKGIRESVIGNITLQSNGVGTLRRP